MADEDLLKNVR